MKFSKTQGDFPLHAKYIFLLCMNYNNIKNDI